MATELALRKARAVPSPLTEGRVPPTPHPQASDGKYNYIFYKQ